MGTSTPSSNRSTVTTMFRCPALKRDIRTSRSRAGVSDDIRFRLYSIVTQHGGETIRVLNGWTEHDSASSSLGIEDALDNPNSLFVPRGKDEASIKLPQGVSILRGVLYELPVNVVGKQAIVRLSQKAALQPLRNTDTSYRRTKQPLTSYPSPRHGVAVTPPRILGASASRVLRNVAAPA